MADLTGVDPKLAMEVQALINASHGRINVQSGFRTHDQQASLYAREPNLAAPPGHSNHEKGLAVDLGGDYALIKQLAPQFGLTLPMSWEPWHVEMPETRQGTQPAAYTNSPYGQPNPTQDATIATQPENILATAANSMRELSALGEVSGPSGQTPSTQAAGQSAGVGGTGSTSGTYSTTPGQGGGGQVSPGQLYHLLRAQGVDPVHAAALVSIAGRESSYNPSAHNGNAGTGDNSYGLFQINLLGGMHSQFTPQMLTTAEGSAQAAAQMVKSGGLQPWGPYKNMSWSNGTNLQTGVDASGGEVTLDQLKGIVNEGLH